MDAAEAELWRLWKARRDRDAFRRLVAAHEAFVHDFARRVCGHDADAEDIAQEAFLELAEAPVERPLEVGLRAFLGRRIVLAAKTLKRAALSRRAKEEGAPPPAERPSAHAEAEEALALLDGEEREAVVLRFLHGLSYAEVGEVLGISEGAARVRVHRALQRLRARLGPKAEQAIAALPLFLPAKTFSRAATAAAAIQGGAAVMTASANRYLVVAIVLLLLAGGLVVARVLPSSRATARAVSRAKPAGAPAEPAGGGEAAREDEGTAAAHGDTRQAPVAEEPLRDRAGKESVSGRLRFTDGTPGRGMRLRVEAHLDEATTDEDGRFTFEGSARPPFNKLYHVGPDDYMLSLAAIAEGTSDIVIERGVPLHGNVLLEGAGQPIAGALLELTCPGAAATRTVQAAWGKARSDAEGRFAFEHVPRATYDIVVTGTGIEPLKTSVQVFEGSLPVQIVVRPARAMTVRFANLPDRMVGGKVTLGVWGKGGAPFQLWYWDVRIDASREAHAEAPPPGRYGIRIFAPRGEPTTPVGFKEAEFESVAGEPVIVVLESKAGARLVGTLLLADGGPLAGGHVRLERNGLYAQTDGGGRFAIDDVPPGEESLVVRVGMTDLRLGTLHIEAEGEVRHDVRLAGTGAIVGRFTSAQGEINAHVALRRKSDGEVVARASFGTGADFRIPYLDPGDYDLFGAVLRKGSVRRAITVANDTVDVGDLAIEPTPEVPVVATVPAGAKVAGEVQVRGKGPDGDAYGWLALDDAGRGFLRGLRPGRYRLSFTAPGCAPLEADVEVEAEPSRPLTFALVAK